MHVLMSIAEMGSGGAERIVADLGGEVLRSGDRVTVATAGGWRLRGLAAAGADTLTIPLRSRRPGSLLAATAQLRRGLRADPPDVVHAHNVRATVAAFLGLRAGGRRPPLLTTVHGLPATDYPRAVRILRHTSDLVVAVSTDVADRLHTAGLPRERVRVIENGVDAPATGRPTTGQPADGQPADGRPADGQRAAARAVLGLPADVAVALCPARMVPQKRHDLLLTSWLRLADPDAVLLVAGDGPLRSALAEVAGLGSAAGRIRFLGERDDVDTLLAAADLLVLTSDWEGLPMSVLEAMAAGVPVVARAVGGLAELGDSALELVPTAQPDAGAAAVDRVLHDSLRRKELIARGRALTRTRFAADTMRSSYLRLYRELSESEDG